MSKPVSDLNVLTANRLDDGEVVYLAADFTWALSINQASVARNKDDCDKLVLEGEKSAQRNEVVDPYLIPVGETPEGIEPLHFREKFRATGPSVRPDLGKQARDGGEGSARRQEESGFSGPAEPVAAA